MSVKDCLVCANDFDDLHLHCLSECGHDGVCSLCYLRMRALTRDMRCPICKASLETVICSEQPDASFSSYAQWGNSIGPDFEFDGKSDMFFPKQYYREQIQPLWHSQCSVCKTLKRDPLALKKHAQSDHNLVVCALCVENKSAFPSEHHMYTQAQYERHLRRGDGDGSEGHPNCEFCRRRYYDKTALFVHLSKDHYTCHLCDKAGAKYKYFEKYESLEQHFRAAHFLCEDRDCLATKFMVFGNEIDFAGHNRQYHPSVHSSKTIPIQFKTHKSASESSLADISRGGREGEFDAGMGGKVRQGEWQVELGNIAADPRDNLRLSSVGELDPFRDEGLPIERSLEEYPSLPVPQPVVYSSSSGNGSGRGTGKSAGAKMVENVSGGLDLSRMTALGWIKVDKRLQDRKKEVRPITSQSQSVPQMRFYTETKQIRVPPPAPPEVDQDDELQRVLRASLEERGGRVIPLASKLRTVAAESMSSVFEDPPLSVNRSAPSAPTRDDSRRQRSAPASADTWGAALLSVKSAPAKIKGSHGISGVIRPKAPTALLGPKASFTVQAKASSAAEMAATPPPGFDLGSNGMFNWNLKSDAEISVGVSDVQDSMAQTPQPMVSDAAADFPSLPPRTAPVVSAKPTKKVVAVKKPKAVSDVISMAFR